MKRTMKATRKAAGMFGVVCIIGGVVAAMLPATLCLTTVYPWRMSQRIVGDLALRIIEGL